MPVLNVIIATVASTVQGAFKKYLNARCQNCEFTVSTMITFFALIFFLIFSDNITFSRDYLPYCGVYAVCYACAAVTFVLAIACGSLAMTQLILSYSCVIPMIYSLMCGETLGIFQIIGIALLFLSLVVTYYRKSKPGERKTASVKWIVYILLLLLSNGFCGVISRMQQLRFVGVYDRSFMFVSLGLAVILLAIAAIFREGRRMTGAIKRGVWLSAGCGASNGLANFFNLICLATIPNAVYYPMKSAADLLMATAMAVFFFKEKLRPAQYVGVGLGALALIFINIS